VFWKCEAVTDSFGVQENCIKQVLIGRGSSVKSLTSVEEKG